MSELWKLDGLAEWPLLGPLAAKLSVDFRPKSVVIKVLLTSCKPVVAVQWTTRNDVANSLNGDCGLMADEPIKGPASYFPSIEKKYGRPIAEWQELVRQKMPAKHMELVAMLKNDHGVGHGHANALVAHTLAEKD